MLETTESTALPAEVETTLEKLLALAPEYRLAISQRLAASVAQEDIEKAWSSEIARRIAEIESGAVKGIPGDEVFRKIEERSVSPYEFHPDAERELNDEIDWYNRKQSGLGEEFAVVVKQGVTRIRKDLLTGSPGEFDTRELLLKRFPFKIVFRVFGEMLWIIAVAHTARHPDYWHHRLDDISES